MKGKKYVINDPKKMALRDHLAYDRTTLANDRTFLAYARTAIMSLATGITFVKLFADDQILRTIGYVVMGLSLVIAIIGIYKYFFFRNDLREVYERPKN